MTLDLGDIPWYGWLVLGLFLAAAVVFLAYRELNLGKSMNAVKHQVQNTHDINLRDDLDEKFKGMLAAVNAVKSDVGEVRAEVRGTQSDIRGMRRDIGRISDEQVRVRERLDDVEDTVGHD